MKILSVLFFSIVALASPGKDCFVYRSRGSVQIKKATSLVKQTVHEGMELSLDDSIFVSSNSAIDIAYKQSVIPKGQCATTVKEIVSSNKDKPLYKKMWEYLFEKKKVLTSLTGRKGEAQYNVDFFINGSQDTVYVKPGEVFYIDVVNNEDLPACVALLWQSSTKGKDGIKKETVDVIKMSLDSPADMPLCEIIPPKSSVRYYLKNSESAQPGEEKAILVIEMEDLFDPFTCLTSDNRMVVLNTKKERIFITE